MPSKKYQPNNLRQTIVRMARHGDSNHLGCAFSVVEIIATIFENFLPKESEFFLSKGHGVMALYAALVEKGVLPASMVDSYFCDGSKYAGLAEAHVPGIRVSSGSLGHGICVATGVAFARKRKGNLAPVYCLVGDGELNEGSCWEAILFAGHHKLSNLVILVDKNGWQAMGRTEDVMTLGKLEDKFAAFGFQAAACDGHDCDKLKLHLQGFLESDAEMPKALVCHTIKGQGVSFMQDDNRWHYLRLNDELYQQAMAELKK